MNKLAAVSALLLGLMLILTRWSGAEFGGAWMGWAILLGGWLALLMGAETLRRGGATPWFLIPLALLALVRFLPLFFQTNQLWPYLAVIGAAMFAFGFGLLSWILDRYQPETDDSTAAGG